jgi:uncharacterized protein (TIGR02996 family)
MTVYFVHRSHETPALNRLKKFNEATLLEWFQKHWKPLKDENDEDTKYVHQLLGCNCWPLVCVLHQIGEQSLEPPKTFRQLEKYLKEHWYGAVSCSSHCVQGLETEKRELEEAFYFFDDEYLARRGNKAAFLLQPDWQLPIGHRRGQFKATGSFDKFQKLRPKGTGDGTTYFAFMAYYWPSEDEPGYDNFTEPIPPYRLDGVRLPELAQHLVSITPPNYDTDQVCWPLELLLLRAELFNEPPNTSREELSFLDLLRENPQDEATWQVYSDWLEDRGLPRANRTVLQRALERVSRNPLRANYPGDLSSLEVASIPLARQGLRELVQQQASGLELDPSKSLFQVEDHVAQVCLYTEDDGFSGEPLYQRWIFFDDLWASAHADLANAILAHGRRWEVLS